MYNFDLSTIAGWITAVYQIITGVLRLDPAVYKAVIAHPDSDKLALAVLLTVGLSIAIGHSAILFVNRVERRRFLLSFVISSLTFVFGVLMLTFSIWLTVVVLFNPSTPFKETLIVVGLSFAPLIYGLFIIIPYLGHILEYALRVWVLMAALMGVYTIFNISVAAALFSGVLGWMLFEIVSNIAVLQTLEQWIWRKGAGQSGYVESQEAVDLFIQEIQTAVSQSKPSEGSNA